MKGFFMAIVCILLIWAVVDGQQMFRPANVARKVVKPIVKPIIDEIRDRVIDPVTGREVKGKTVIVVSRDWCKYCGDLIRTEMPKARRAGYTVIVDKKTEAMGYPMTRIWDGKAWEQRDGFFKWSKP
jgi:hypothetical protein